MISCLQKKKDMKLDMTCLFVILLKFPKFEKVSLWVF